MPLIRPAKLCDLESLATLHAQASFDPRTGEVGSSRTEYWQHLLGGGARRTQVWVALDPAVSPEGEPIGFIIAGGARLLAAHYRFEITALYVGRPHQRQGLGSALLETALATLFRDEDHPSVMAWVLPQSPGAQFLEKSGWSIDPTIQRTHEGQTEVAAHL